MFWQDRKFIVLLSPLLRNFKKKTEDLYQFSCPYCGDSHKSKYKARGYIYLKGGTYLFRCHNCGKGTTFDKLVEFVNPILYKEMRFEKYRVKDKEEDTNSQNSDIMDFFREAERKKELASVCLCVSDLMSDHEAVKYLTQREIPKHFWSGLFYTNDVNNLKAIFTNYDERELEAGPRLVVPIYNRRKELIGISARALGKAKSRYVILKHEVDEHLLYNYENVNLSQKIYAFEGAFDSMFFPNSIAVDGSDFTKLDGVLPKENSTLVFDNEPRNRQIVGLMETMADRGWTLCIWPSTIEQKDVNEMVLYGMKPEEIKEIVDQNSYSGLTLKLKIAEWRKI